MKATSQGMTSACRPSMAAEKTTRPRSCSRVQEVVQAVENAYWDLSYALGNLDAKKEALEAAGVVVGETPSLTAQLARDAIAHLRVASTR